MQSPAAALIVNTETERKQHFETLYRSVFPKVAAFISSRNGSLADAKDVFQDALVLYYEQLAAQATTIRSADAYILGIAKHLWFRKFEKQQITGPLSDDELSVAAPVEESINEHRLLNILADTGQKCMDLLYAFYYHCPYIWLPQRAVGNRTEI